MKITKAFLKMNKDEQLDYLIIKFKEANDNVNKIHRMMGALRSGKKIESEIERPDEIILKDA